jgi:cysteine desulfurase/selenocysteine lyase
MVLDAMDEYYRLHNANIHRGVYTLSEEATQMLRSRGEKVSAFY